MGRYRLHGHVRPHSSLGLVRKCSDHEEQEQRSSGASAAVFGCNSANISGAMDAKSARILVRDAEQPATVIQVVQYGLWPVLDALKTPRCGLHAFRHYVWFLTMSSDIGQRPVQVGRSRSKRRFGEPIAQHSLLALQAVEEPEELIAGVLTSRSAIKRCRPGESLLLHR